MVCPWACPPACAHQFFKCSPGGASKQGGPPPALLPSLPQPALWGGQGREPREVGLAGPSLALQSQRPPGPLPHLHATRHQPEERGNQRHGENIHLRIYYNTLFPNTKEGTGGGAECGRAGGRAPRQGRAAQSRETRSHAGDPPPLRRWTFQQILGGGGVHCEAAPNARAGEGGGVGGPRDLGEGWGPAPPHLGQCVEVAREGLAPGPGSPRRGVAETGPPPVAAAHFGVTRASRARAPPHTSRQKSQEMLAALRKGRGRKGRGRGTCLQSSGAQPVAPDHCLLDSTGVGAQRRDQCILHTQGHLRNPTR